MKSRATYRYNMHVRVFLGSIFLVYYRKKPVQRAYCPKLQITGEGNMRKCGDMHEDRNVKDFDDSGLTFLRYTVALL